MIRDSQRYLVGPCQFLTKMADKRQKEKKEMKKYLDSGCLWIGLGLHMGDWIVKCTHGYLG